MFAVGALLCIAAGLGQGTFALPMKHMSSSWRWENTWFVFSLFACLILPWLLITVLFHFHPSRVMHVYAHAGWRWRHVVPTYGCGVGWGVGSVLFGIAVDHVGQSVGFAFILGVTTITGTMLPLLVFHAHRAGMAEGLSVWVSIVPLILGLYLLVRAAASRDREQAEGATPLLTPVKANNDYGDGGGGGGGGGDDDGGQKWRVQRLTNGGVVLCIASGVLSGLLNLGSSFAAPIQTRVQHDYSKTAGTVAVWTLTLAGGATSQLLYTGVLMTVNHTWHRLWGGDGNGDGDGSVAKAEIRWRDVALHWLGGGVMGLIWFSCAMVYGVASAQMMGSLGAVIGWPAFIISMIFSSTLCGVCTGEWSHTSQHTHRLMYCSTAALALTILIVAVGPKIT